MHDRIETIIEPQAALRGLNEKMGDRLFLADDGARRRSAATSAAWSIACPARWRAAPPPRRWPRWCATAAQHGMPIVPRGQGHTQSGQATNDGGVLLDTSAMRRIHEIDAVGLTATCDGGVVWRDLVAATGAEGLVPPVLTNNLGVSSPARPRWPASASRASATAARPTTRSSSRWSPATGEIVVCSREPNRELFDVVRCGFGQFGIITRVKTRLRRCAAERAHVLPALRRPRHLHARRRGDHGPGRRALPHPRVAQRAAARSSPSASARAWSSARGCRSSPTGCTRCSSPSSTSRARIPTTRRCSRASSTTSTCTPRSTRSSSSATAWSRSSSSGSAPATGRWRIPGWR